MPAGTSFGPRMLRRWEHTGAKCCRLEHGFRVPGAHAAATERNQEPVRPRGGRVRCGRAVGPCSGWNHVSAQGVGRGLFQLAAAVPRCAPELRGVWGGWDAPSERVFAEHIFAK